MLDARYLILESGNDNLEAESKRDMEIEPNQQLDRDVVCVALERLAFTIHNEEMGNTNWF